MDVQSPEGSSPTHALPSLSGRDNERETEGGGGQRKRISYIQGNHMEQDSPSPGNWKNTM